MSEQLDIETALQVICIAYQKGADHCFHCEPNPTNPYSDMCCKEAFEYGLEHARKEKRPCIIEDTEYWKNPPNLSSSIPKEYFENVPEIPYSFGLDGHNEPCYYCGELTNSLAGDPGSWPLGFTHNDGTGVVRWHHTRCVQERLFKQDEADGPKTV